MPSSKNSLTDAVTVVVLGGAAEPALKRLSELGPGVTIKHADKASGLSPELADARVLFQWAGSRDELKLVLAGAPRLEWIHGRYAGLDAILCPELIESPVQRIPVDLFRTLRANDILFIDSSHVVSMDSDVLYECLHILPELAPGVLIHFHDVFTPLDYPRKFVMTNLCFWGEQYLLEAFLSFNSAFRVVWAGSAMQKFHPDVLREAFPGWEGSFARMPEELKVFAPTLDSNNVWPCSFWIARS